MARKTSNATPEPATAQASGIAVYCAHDRLADVTALVPNPRNPNRHPDKQIALLAKIIKAQGWRSPIVVSKRSGFIVKGHGRLEAAKLLQVEQVPVDDQDYENEAVEWADMIADNKLAELAETDDEALTALLKDLESMDIDIELAGMSKADVQAATQTIGTQDAEPQIDKAEELRKKWGVETGQLWELGEHRLLCGDSKEPSVVQQVIGQGKASCIFTDPPYGVAIGSKNRMLKEFRKCGHNSGDIIDDALSPDDLKCNLLPVFQNIRDHAMAEDCTLFVTAPQGGELGMMMMMMEAGLKVRHVLIWKKNCATFSMGRLDYDYQHEPILLTWGKRHKRPMLGQHKTSVWEIDKPRASVEHPTMKPVELVVNAYLNNSDKGDIVFDAYSGSGTSIIAAEQTGRRCRAIEISPGYVAVAIQRWADATGKEPRRLTQGG